MDFERFSEVTRQLVQHEDSLRDQRVNWLMGSQGILYASLGFVWDKSSFVAGVISLVGVVTCVSIGGSLLANTAAVRKICSEWAKRRPTEYDGPSVIGLRSAEDPHRWARRLYPWHILPWVLLASWLAILGRLLV
ncbi:MAG TPA: hypothetical protein PLS53_07305 [Thermoanaerobaculaceae bacterium]|nr:hypothetical protein [Thermoanaerobaculaceae bacterium]HPS77942.1 hypothetical protein [Thermoanaerobaculaceae bacterium]